MVPWEIRLNSYVDMLVDKFHDNVVVGLKQYQEYYDMAPMTAVEYQKRQSKKEGTNNIT